MPAIKFLKKSCLHLNAGIKPAPTIKTQTSTQTASPDVVICPHVLLLIECLTAGQYLRSSVKHAEIKKYYHPDEFKEVSEVGRKLGIRWVFSGPLVRSSYHAEDVFDQMMARSG